MNCSKLLSTMTAVFAATLLPACSGGDTSSASKPSEPAIAVDQTAKPVEAPVQETAAELSPEEALLKRGKIVWFKCRSCHETSATGRHKVGPNLHGMMGATAGRKDGFAFSKAMKDSEIVWTDEALDAFIEKPSAVVNGTKMAFVGLRKEYDRQAVIAYIKENTK